MNYHNKKFRAVQNTENGEISIDTVFLYSQQNEILTCSYSGGSIKLGQLIGLVDDVGHIDMRYHHINDKGQILTGICRSEPEILPNGKVRLHEQWQWTSGDHSKGYSILEEL